MHPIIHTSSRNTYITMYPIRRALTRSGRTLLVFNTISCKSIPESVQGSLPQMFLVYVRVSYVHLCTYVERVRWGVYMCVRVSACVRGARMYMCVRAKSLSARRCRLTSGWAGLLPGALGAGGLRQITPTNLTTCPCQHLTPIILGRSNNPTTPPPIL